MRLPRASVPVVTVLATALGLAELVHAPPARDSSRLQGFTTALDELATDTHIPGLSAAIVRDHELIWSHGFGHADVEKRTPARPDTPYRLASVTKPIAAVVLLQLVEAGGLNLDAPMRDFRVHVWFEPGGGSWAHYPARYADGRITVRHVLTHTSQATQPGDAYSYSGNIYADLTWVIEHVTQQSYPRVITERILEPLGMTRSSPGELVPWRQDAARRIAKPHKIVDGKAVPATYPGFGLDPDADVTPWNLDPAYRLPRETQTARQQQLGDAFTPLHSSQTAAGMLASVEDLARFDIALDRNEIISESSRAQMFSASRTSKGDVLPYGLGWFVEERDGLRLVWHYGWSPPTVSALYLKVPDQRLTFILLANCDALSANVAWSALGVRASPFARLFLDQFVTGVDSD